MISYDTCLSFSGWLHLVWSSLGPSVLLHMALFHSFSWLSNIPLYICTTSSGRSILKLGKCNFLKKFAACVLEDLCRAFCRSGGRWWRKSRGKLRSFLKKVLQSDLKKWRNCTESWWWDRNTSRTSDPFSFNLLVSLDVSAGVTP